MLRAGTPPMLAQFGADFRPSMDHKLGGAASADQEQSEPRRDSQHHQVICNPEVRGPKRA